MPRVQTLTLLLVIVGPLTGARSAHARPSGAMLVREGPTNRSVQAETFRDPAGRFSVMVPPGWNAMPQSGGVIIANGGVTAMFSPFSGARSGAEVVSALSSQYGAQWRDMRTVDQGTFSVAGRPASYMVLSGVNPRGTPSLLRLAGFTDARDAYAVIMSAPQNEFNAVSRTLQAIEASFTIGDGAPIAPGAPSLAEPGPMQGGGALGIRYNAGRGGPATDPRAPNPGANQGGFGGAPSGRAMLGVATRDVEPADLPRIGINERLGAFIEQVAPGSAAERAGLVPGDLILSADRQTIKQHVELQRIVQGHKPGESVELIIMRQGRPITLQVALR